jgi:DNA-directed RNA polymerase specialized sigma24 family protein
VKMRSSPEVERLEARQLPYAALSAAGLSSIVALSAEPAAKEQRSSLVVLSPGSDEALRPDESQAAGNDDVGSAPSPVAALWLTPTLAGNSPPGQATAQFSWYDARKNNASLQELKGDSVSPGHTEKVVSLSEPNSANESLSPSEARASYPTIKQPRGFLPGGRGGFSSEELSFREEGMTTVILKQKERSLSTQRSHFSSEVTAPAERRANWLFSMPPREPTSAELETVFSSLASALAKDAFGFRLAEGKGFDARGVERFFSLAGCGSPSVFLPAREGGPLPRQVEELLAGLWGVLPGLGQPPLRTTQPDEGQPAEGRENLPLPPLYLGVLLYRQPGKPLDPSAQQGLDRLCAYAWSSIRNAERAHGEKFLSPEDIVQEIYLEWRGLVGQKPEDEALSRLLQDSSEEMRFLRVAVQRVIGRTRYQQKQWAKEVDLHEPAGGSAAFARRGEQERVDWEDLWENVVSTLAPHEKQVLELRKQGKTFAEIGSALGMPRQRVCETYHSVVARLQKSYPEW